MSDARTEAIERALRDIEVELQHHLTAYERPVITWVLERLADDVRVHRREPWE